MSSSWISLTPRSLGFKASVEASVVVVVLLVEDDKVRDKVTSGFIAGDEIFMMNFLQPTFKMRTLIFERVHYATLN